MSPQRERARILCVDDEAEVLRGLSLHLGRRYEVLTALSGAAGLEQLERDPRVAVIISDMRMPGLSGAEFLSRSRSLAPDAQRILLTGQTDLASAVAAINDGQIFRFLSKPCPPAELISAIEAALEQQRSRALEHAALRRKVEDGQLQVDPLTGLASRLQLMGVLETAAHEATESVGALIAYFIAIDGSDEPVAVQEQPWGDALSKIVAQRLKQDFPQATVIACWGIEQFVVIVPGAGASDAELHARGEELLGVLTAPITVGIEHIAVSAGIGIARLVDRLEWQRLIQQAATAARETSRGAPGLSVSTRCASIEREATRVGACFAGGAGPGRAASQLSADRGREGGACARAGMSRTLAAPHIGHHQPGNVHPPGGTAR